MEGRHCAENDTESFKPFLINGTTKDNSVFEFPKPANGAGTVLLRDVVSHYISGPNQRIVQAHQLYMISGRLKCLHHTIHRYNEGVATPSSVFLQYWRPRTLNLLSGFGFHAKNEEQLSILGLKELIDAIEGLFLDDICDARQLIKGGLITFDALGELYQPGAPFQAPVALGGASAVFLVADYYYEEHRGLLGTQKNFYATLEFVATMGEYFTVVSFTEVLSGWTGVRARPLSTLTYLPLDTEARASLQERGERYVRYGGGGAKFLAYTPHTFFLHRSGSATGQQVNALARSRSTQLPSGGRVMIDMIRASNLGYQAGTGVDEPTLALANATGLHNQWKSRKTGRSWSMSDALSVWEDVPPELVLFCWPVLVGFSFTAKAWGQVLVDGLETIRFHHEAFDRLVLAEERKQLIRALVRFGGHSGVDVVDGKRGGSIFLLHGPPGVGKTLTAEAIAEFLHLPLYSVTMGELGTTAQSLQERLGDVLDLCAEWDALTLLDEADLFVEQRSSSDLNRNAIVCVMLRLLEYHPGILFLTTNRVRALDPAFESRVTVAMRYDPLAFDARLKVWEALLGLIPIPVDTNANLQKLAGHELNGREIKTAVRLSVALAKERASPTLTQQILDETLQTTLVGRQEMSRR